MINVIKIKENNDEMRIYVDKNKAVIRHNESSFVVDKLRLIELLLKDNKTFNELEEMRKNELEVLEKGSDTDGTVKS